jgi:hypothetical protein
MLRPLIACFVLALFAVGCGGGSKPTKPNPPVTSFRAQPDHIDFGAVLLGAHRDTTFTVTNTGTTPIDGALGDTSSQFILTGQAGLYLSPGQTGSYSLRFAPTRAGAVSVSINLADVGTLPVTGTGQTPPILACSVNPTTIDFGTVNVGQVVDRTFTLTNLSTSSMTGSLTDTSTIFTVPGSTSYSLAPNESATFIVRYTPIAAGPRGATIRTGQAGCPSVGCSAIAAQPCAVNPTSVDFGDVAVSQYKDTTFTIANVGNSVLAGSISIPCPALNLVGSPASYSLNPGQSAAFTLRYAPISGSGGVDCFIQTGTGCSDLHVTGLAHQLPGDCGVSPSLLDFGDVVVGNTATAFIHIRNDASTNGPQLSGSVGAHGSAYYVPSPVYLVNPGQTVDIAVIFNPPGLGAWPGSLSITQGGCTGCGGPCRDVQLTGNGITTPPPAVCALNTNNIQLGVFHSGATKDTTFTLSNTGGGTLSGHVSFLDASAAPFSLIGPTTYAIAAGQSQSFTLRYIAPSVPVGHTYSDVRMIDVGTGCPGLGPVSIGATAIP